jgi:hypothetical protein
MKSFLGEKRKFIQLGLLVFLDALFWFLWGSWDVVVLFSLGFIWNWTAAQDLESIISSKKYRFSTLKIIFNLQHLILKPFKNSHEAIRFFLRIIPAGLFWVGVMYFNESQLPWWSVFMGSFFLEVFELDKKLIERQTGQL